jgi:copper transport outer membrane protein MctB
MIDFRYHLVSIVAVFLALAIGIVLGSTELRGNTLELLQSSSNSLKNQLNAVSAQRDGYQAQASAADQSLQAAEPRLLAGLLDGDRIVIVTEPGAPGSVVDGIKRSAAAAGATVTGQVALQPKFNDLSGATQSSLGSINSSIASSDAKTLTEASDPRTGYQQQAAQLIATAILDKTAGDAGLTADSAQTLLSAYAQGGYLNVSGTPTDRATLAVIVTPQTAPSDGPNDPANRVLLAVAQQFAAVSAATLVAGGTAGSAQAGSAISVLRSSSVSGQVSSVDNADSTLGQISVAEALAVQAAGGKPHSYGIFGASAVSPLPLPSPSVTATAPATAHPKATVKGVKKT